MTPPRAFTLVDLIRLFLLSLGIGVATYVALTLMVLLTVRIVPVEWRSGAVLLMITLRGLIGITVVALAALWYGERWRSYGMRAATAVAVASYAISPATYAGKTLWGQVLGNHVLAIVLDGVLWVGVFVGVVWLRRRPAGPEPY